MIQFSCKLVHCETQMMPGIELHNENEFWWKCSICKLVEMSDLQLGSCMRLRGPGSEILIFSTLQLFFIHLEKVGIGRLVSTQLNFVNCIKQVICTYKKEKKQDQIYLDPIIGEQQEAKLDQQQCQRILAQHLIQFWSN